MNHLEEAPGCGKQRGEGSSGNSMKAGGPGHADVKDDGKDGGIPDECDLRYERMDKLGEGTYGVVYKARDVETNEVTLSPKNRILDRGTQENPIRTC